MAFSGSGLLSLAREGKRERESQREPEIGETETKREGGRGRVGVRATERESQREGVRETERERGREEIAARAAAFGANMFSKVIVLHVSCFLSNI